jgi:hypothetical protein
MTVVLHAETIAGLSAGDVDGRQDVHNVTLLRKSDAFHGSCPFVNRIDGE